MASCRHGKTIGEQLLIIMTYFWANNLRLIRNLSQIWLFIKVTVLSLVIMRY